jgi:hypothetical protein
MLTTREVPLHGTGRRFHSLRGLNGGLHQRHGIRHGKGCAPLKKPGEPCKKNRPKDMSYRKSENLHNPILEREFLFVNEAFDPKNRD